MTMKCNMVLAVVMFVQNFIQLSALAHEISC